MKTDFYPSELEIKEENACGMIKIMLEQEQASIIEVWEDSDHLVSEQAK
jgi:hypothetical protein